MKQRPKLIRMFALGLTLASIGATVNAGPEHSIGIDHILIGVPDLDRTLDELAKTLGVRPVYGGKHPGGTHNALLSLGTRTYLEFIALQPGVAGANIGMGELVGLTKPVPIGWAVGAPSVTSLTASLAHSDFALSEPDAGSRVTPSGGILKWQSLHLVSDPAAALFFIIWAPDTHHPSATSPQGCRLVGFQVTTPDSKRLRALCSTLNLPVEILDGPRVRFSVALDCPKGHVTFRTDP